MKRWSSGLGVALGLAFAMPPDGVAQQLSPNGVKTLSPAGAIKPTGTWNLGTRAGDFVFVAGMRGIDPKTNALVPGEEARVLQAFRNMQMIAESEGASLRDAVRLVVYVTDMYATGRSSTRCRNNYGAAAPIRRAPSSRSTASTRMTSSKSRERFTRRRSAEECLEPIS